MLADMDPSSKGLRIIYGPEYLLPENLERLRSRNVGAKRSLANREFALGIEALERFVRNEPLRLTHEWVFGVLALGKRTSRSKTLAITDLERRPPVQPRPVLFAIGGAKWKRKGILKPFAFSRIGDTRRDCSPSVQGAAILALYLEDRLQKTD